MKKVMMVMAIVAALSFLVSLLAVVPSFAAKATQTQPTTKQQTQQGTVQTPASQDIKKPAGFKPTAMEKPKEKFWDLEFDRLEVKGVVIKKGGGNKTINVKVGENVQFKAYYKVKTIPVGDITEADAMYWGSGKFLYSNYLLIINHTAQGNNPIHLFDTNKSLPQFTWQNVQGWKRGIGKGNNPKIWNESSVFQWTAGPECVGSNVYMNCFCVDWYKKIPETNEPNNGFVDSDLLVTFIVTP